MFQFHQFWLGNVTWQWIQVQICCRSGALQILATKPLIEAITATNYQVLGVEQVSVNAKEGGNDYCIYLGVEQVYYT